MPRLANNALRGPISRREMFKTNSGAVYPRRVGDLYVVYSYGDHFPMWVYDGHINQWFGNQDRWSRTTSKQQSQTRPDVEMTMWSTDTLRRIVNLGGFVQYTAKRILREETAA